MWGWAKVSTERAARLKRLAHPWFNLRACNGLVMDRLLMDGSAIPWPASSISREPGDREAIERHHQEHGFKMVQMQMQANMHDYQPDRAKNWIRLAFEKCAELGLMVKLHTGDGQYTTPTEWVPMTNVFLTVNFIMANFGVKTGGVHTFEPFQRAMVLPSVQCESGSCPQPQATRYNIEQIVRLGTYSRDTLQQLRRDTGLNYDQRTQGILHFYTTQKEFDGALKPAEQMRALGCDRKVISADEAVKIEPALAHIRPQLAGATYTAEDESGDANRFARELVALASAAGVNFLMSHTVTALRETGGSIDHVEATDNEGRFQRIRGDALVLVVSGLAPEVDFAFTGPRARAAPCLT